MLLGHALEGAASKGAKTELVHLYDLDYKGCTSCFSCKLVGGKSYGKCAVQDDLTPVLERILDADALILGSPIYVGTATGEMRSFLERLVFPYIVYDAARSSLFPKKMPTGFIYTMGADEARVKDMAYESQFRLTAMLLERIFGPSEWFMVTDTLQFDDYSKYVSSAFDPEEKAQRCREVFPEDCKKAFALGKRLGQPERRDQGINPGQGCEGNGEELWMCSCRSMKSTRTPDKNILVVPLHTVSTPLSGSCTRW